MHLIPKIYFLLAIFVIGTAQAQTDHSGKGILIGTVLDRDSNAPVYGGTVVIVGSTLGGIVDEQGHYRITSVPAGTYQVRASALGYATRIYRDIAVKENDTTTLEIVLTEQSIEVSEVVIAGDLILDKDVVPQTLHHAEYKEIHNTAGAFDDVIRTVTIMPGMAHSSPEHNHLYVRGGGTTENLFFIDRIEVPNINHFGAQGSTGGSMSYVNFEFIENFTFSNGGFGVQYGDKLSSVLNIGIRKGRTDRQRGKATVSATMVGLNMEGPIAGESSYLLSIRRSYLDPVFKYYGFSFIPVFWDLLGKIHIPIDKYNTLEILGIGALDKMMVNNASAQNRYDNERLLFSDQFIGVGGITWKHGFDEGMLTLTGRKYYADFNYRQYRNEKNLFRNISYEDEHSLRADLTLFVSDNTELSAGSEIKIAQLDSRVIATVILTGYTEYPTTIAVDTTQHAWSHKGSLYTQVTHAIGNMKLSLGIRSDYFSLIKNEAVIAPRLSLSYALTEGTTLSFGIGRYYQSPAYVWLMTNPFNRGLNHLAMNQIIAGIEQYLASDLKISLEGYIKAYDEYPGSIARPYIVMVNSGTDVTDLVEAYTAFGLDFLGSVASGVSRGIDLFLEKRLSEIPLYGRVSIGLSETRFTAFDGISRPSNNDQRIVLNAGGGYIFNEQWEGTATFRYSSGRPYAPIGVGDSRFFERSSALYNTARTQENHRLDVRISRRWSLDPFLLITYLDIQNLYNRKWRGVPYYNNLRKAIELPNSTGIVPSLGIIAEF